MRISASLMLLIALGVPLGAQRRGARTGPVTFTIMVTNASGAPVTDARVTVTGPVQRSSRTERGRAVFENLPAGEYRFRFEKNGFVPLERDVTGRGSAPIQVKVALTTAMDTTPIPPVGPLKDAPLEARFVVLDMPAFIEKNYVGKAAGKMTPMGCSAGGMATLIQINDPLAEHTHADADEFIYVVAGQGMARVRERQESLGPGVFLMIPRGAPHSFTPSKKPLVMVSTRAGEKCTG